MLKLYIGNKNYSSWSMRPWVLMQQAGIAFDEVMVRFDSFDAQSRFKQVVNAVNPLGKVPTLVDSDLAGGLAVRDSLAISEYLAEKFPEMRLWPGGTAARAHARSLCAEMHSGFGALRSHCPMNIEASLPEIGQLVWRDQTGVRADVTRIVSMWSELLATHRGAMLFGEFSVVDAYFAPVVMRLVSYALPVPPAVSDYMKRVCALHSVQAWITDALAEHDFVVFDEPYRLHR